MNIEEIRAKAPEGATHYREYSDQYQKMENGKWYLWREGYWELTTRPFTHELKPLY